MIRRLITPLALAVLLVCAGPALAQSAASPEPAVSGTAKAYIINEITITDPAGYAEYVRLAPAVVARFGGRYIVRAGAVTPFIGEAPTARVVVVEFPSLDAATAFLASPDYQAILPIRQATSTSRAYLVEGVAP